MRRTNDRVHTSPPQPRTDVPSPNVVGSRAVEAEALGLERVKEKLGERLEGGFIYLGFIYMGWASFARSFGLYNSKVRFFFNQFG